MRLKTTLRWLAALATCLPMALWAQPANDDCAGAIPATFIATAGNGTTTTLPFSTDGTTDSGVPTVCSTPGNDQYFTWTATTAGLSFDSQSPGDPGIAVFASCADAAAGNDIACLGTFATGTLSGWSVGDNLIIQIYDFNGSSSNVAFVLEEYTPPAPPANDECANAVSVTLGTGACGPTVTADNTSATGTAGTACGSTSTSYGDGDIWFSFEAGASTAYLDLITGVGSLYISVYDACGGSCVYDNNLISTSTDEVITGLTAGNTYYIRMYESGNNAFGTIEFCMYNPGSPPANDFCANATPVTLGSGTCGPTVTATNAFATGTAGDVCGSTSTSYGDGDIWFSFEAGGSSAFLDLTAGVGSLYISVYDACGGSCVYDNNFLSTSSVEEITGLTAGNTYYIRMYEFGNDAFGSIEFCMFNAGGPPANDLCANATPVTLGSGTCGPTVTATNAFATGTAGDVCGSTSTSYGDGDIWFSFQATTSLAVIDLITGVGSLYISVYDACGGACVYDNNFLSTSTDELIGGLTPGETYYIRMYESGNDAFGTIEFCMYGASPPANNDCSGAIAASVGLSGSCPGGAGAYSEDFSLVSETGIYASCDGFGNYDVWYTWTATSGSIVFTDGTGDPGLAVYSGSCGSLTEIGCINNASGTIGGLTVGQTYYLQVWDDSQGASTVEWCWEAGPTCADPTNLDVTNITQTTADVTFNALAVGSHTVEYGATGFTPGTGTTVNVASGGSVTLTGLTGQTTYDVYVTADCGGATVGPETFTTLGTPPANDECANAVSVTLGTGTCGPTVTADNTNATGVAGTACGSTSTSYGAGDIWFSFEAGASSAYLDLITGVGSLYISVYDACGGSCVYNNNFLSTSTDEEITGLTAGDTYYIRMYESGNNSFGTIEFCMYNPGAPPINDECATATPLVVGVGGTCTSVSGTNVFATDSGYGHSCASYQGGDVWFSAVVPASGNLTVETSNNGGFSDSGMSAYAGCAGTEIDCDDDGGVGTMSKIELTGRTPGETIYFAVWEFGNNSFGTFDICAYEPALPVAELTGCTPMIQATVDGTGTPAIVDFVDGSGAIVAAIANTQNLGVVTVYLYDQVGLRSIGGGSFDLGRNVAIIPTIQPSVVPVAVSIFATDGEVQAMIAQDPNVNAATDLEFLKVSGTNCSAAYPGTGQAVALTPAPYGTDWAFQAAVQTFSEFFVVSSAAALPVELSSFSARAEGARNVVEWSAASEVDVYMYHVERSTDGFRAEVRDLAEVAATGSPEREAVYATADHAPAAVTYYRLRVEDADGSVEYSDVVAVERDDVAGDFQLMPNPVKQGQVTVTFGGAAADAPHTVVLADAAGRVVASRVVAGGRGTLDVSQLPAGVYAVSVATEAGVTTRRLVVE